MTKEQLKELDDYYNNVLLLGGTSFIYDDCFEINKTRDGKWRLNRFLGENHPKNREVALPPFIQVIEKFSFCYYTGAFYELIIPEGVISINLAAFKDCHIEKLGLPNTLKDISSQAFYGTRIKELYIPDKVGKIGELAFYNCQFLKKISLPSGVTIEHSAFERCGEYYSTWNIDFEVRRDRDTLEVPYIRLFRSAFEYSPFEKLAKRYDR